MSAVADFDRTTVGMRELFTDVCAFCEQFFETAVIGDASETAELFKLYDMALTQRAVLSAMLCSAELLGTHGSALVDRTPDASQGLSRTTRTLTRGGISEQAPVSSMPNPELWFETLLAKKRKETLK